MKKSNLKFVFSLILMIGLILSYPTKTSAFASSLTSIYELRDSGSLEGYTGPKRIVAGGVGALGWYLGSDSQFLPYKVSGATTALKDGVTAVTGYSNAVYCTLFGASSPAVNSYAVERLSKSAPASCTIDNSWTTEIKAGVAAMIKNANGTAFIGNNLKKYYDTEIAINKYLYNKLANGCNIDSDLCTNRVTTTLENPTRNYITNVNSDIVNLGEVAGKLAVEKENNRLAVLEPANKVLAYSDTEGSEIWQSQTFAVKNAKYLDKYDGTFDKISTLKLTDSNGKLYENYAYITNVGGESDEDKASNKYNYQIGVCDNNNTLFCKRITDFSPLTPGTYTASFTIGGTKSYDVAQNYSCGSEYQSLTPAIVESKTINEGPITVYFTFTIAQPEEPTARLKIIKVDSKTEKGISGAKFKVTSANGNYSKIVTMDKSYVVLKGLALGKYTITEVEAPEGYEKADEPETVEFTTDNLYEETPFENKLLEHSKVTIKKVDSKDKTKFIEGAELQLCDADGKVRESWTSTTEAHIINDLPIGKYYIEETKTPKGYSLNKNKMEFEITDQGTELTLEFVNDATVAVPNTLSNISKLLIILAVGAILTGAIMIYKNKFSDADAK